MAKLDYKSSGVNYDVMDPFKKMAQIEGLNTVKNLLGTNIKELNQSRGESAYVMDYGNVYLAFVEEGLGTKNLVADAMSIINPEKTYYDQLAQDTVAMMINDLITVGAKPLTVLAYFAAGSSAWFENQQRMEDLVKGWGKACDMSGAVWGGGETPTLTGVINEKAIDLAGACFGIIDPKSRLTLGDDLKEGDAIILFESSGIHANGLSLARKLAEQLLDGYKTKLPSGRTYGETLLDPTIIYAKLIQDLFAQNIDIHYMANITGHGWRKLMRHTKKLTYRIKNIPPVPEVLQFIKQEAKQNNEEAYGNLNMGAGFAIYVPQSDVQKVLEISSVHNIKAYSAGVIENGEKQVIIEPLNITFLGETLQVRA